MEVHLTPELEEKLNRVAKESGRRADDLVQDAMAGYFDELAQIRSMLDRRYDEIKGGGVTPIDGEEVFARLRLKSEERRNSRR